MNNSKSKTKIRTWRGRKYEVKNYLSTFAFLVLVQPLFFTLLWNNIMVSLFRLPTITYWTSCGLLFMAGMLIHNDSHAAFESACDTYEDEQNQ